MKPRLMSLAALALAAGLAAPVLAGDPDEILAAENFEFEPLVVGDPAPNLSITNWVKGEEVSSFETGHIYVVEFWATWCGPCIRGMPHLTELQERHEGDVTVIGVNIWDTEQVDGDGGEQREESLDERVDRVSAWVGQSEDMGYTVAIDGTKKMEEEWMTPAGLGGIPAAFIVDGEGTIAWIGNPLATPPDDVLAELIDGEFDLEAATEEYAETVDVDQLKADAWYGHVVEMFKVKDWDHAYEVAGALLERDWSEQAELLNRISWLVLTHPLIEERDIAFAIKAAERGVELSERENPDVLDTLARGYFLDGQVEKAIETQEEALELLGERDPNRANYEKPLAEYRAALDAR